MNGVNLKNNKNFLEGMRLFEEERKSRKKERM